MSLPPAEVQYQTAHINDSRAPGLIAFLTVGLVVSTLFVVLRFASRLVAKAPLRSDDWTIVAALAFVYGQFIAIFLQISHGGLGKHVLATTPDEVTYTLKSFYIWGIFYDVSLQLIKCSILLLYIRIFIVRTFRIISYVLIGFLSAFSLTLVLVDAFGCTPIQKQWEFLEPGKCVNLDDTYWFASAIFILTDLIILLMPLPMVWRLHMPASQKFGLSLLFGLGIVVTAATCIRLYYAIHQNPFDITYSSADVVYWMGSELILAIVCACSATLPILFRRLSSPRSTAAYSGGYLRQTGEHNSKTDQGDRVPSLKGSTIALGFRDPQVSRVDRLGSFAQAQRKEEAMVDVDDHPTALFPAEGINVETVVHLEGSDRV
ncbi:MAG: hypothetical protein M1838_003711 [Thelocarpon superellum]|nr:MAG: hypothetical protein M1838_003711 [Thelocarpon superellum]